MNQKTINNAQVRRMKEIIKIRAEISKIESKTQNKRSMKPTVGPLKR